MKAEVLAPSVTVRRVRDVFETTPDKVEVLDQPHRPGGRVVDYLPVDFDTGGQNLVVLDGRSLTGAELVLERPRPGAELVVVELPGLTAAALTAAFGGTAFGAFLAGGTAGAITATLIAGVVNIAIVAALNVAVSYGIQALSSSGRRRGQSLSEQREEDPATLTFGSQQNTIGPGVPIPLIYGRVKVYPHILESFQVPRFDELDTSLPTVTTTPADEKQGQDVVYLHTRCGLGWGPLKSITSIELDDNPIENVAGTQVEVVHGQPWQKALEGFLTTKRTRTVQQLVSASAGPVVIQTAAAVDSFEIGLLFRGGLFAVNDQGGLKEHSIQVEVAYKRAEDGSYTIYKTITAAGAVRAPHPYWIAGPKLPRGIYDIRLTRVTADSVDLNESDTLHFETLNELLPGGQVHSGLAQIGIRNLPGEQSRLWSRISAIVEGRTGLRVYDTDTDYRLEYTRNPAWCCADFITHKQDGVGRFYTYDDLDIASFRSWASYCDELIPDGRGGSAPRARFNFELGSLTGGQDMLQLFGQGSATSVVQLGGKYRAIVDRPRPMSALFNERSITQGTLSVSLTPKNERATRILTTFFDEEVDFLGRSFVLEDDEVAPSDGHVDLQIPLQGVTARHQVAWLLRRQLLRNRYSLKTAEFRTGTEGLAVTVGDVIGIAHPSIGSAVATGAVRRVVEDGRRFLVDDDLELDTQKTYSVAVVHQADGHIEQKTLQGVTADVTNWARVGSDWEYTLTPGDAYSILESPIELYQVSEVSTSADLEIRIRAVSYDERIFDDSIDDLPEREAQTLPPARRFIGAVPDLTLGYRSPELPNSGADTVSVPTIDVSWCVPAFGVVDHYEIWMRRDAEVGFRRAGTSVSRHFTIDQNIQSGQTYEVAVIAVSIGRTAPSLADASRALITTS